jgi:hypothetical protein
MPFNDLPRPSQKKQGSIAFFSKAALSTIVHEIRV